jgi:hypothetical protein
MCFAINWRRECESHRDKEDFMRAARSSSENVITVEERIDTLDWRAAEESLSARGYAVTEPLLTPEECAGLVALYKYFDNPLPQTVLSVRTSAYPHLARIANHWAEALGETGAKYPLDHAAFLNICHKAGQRKPTPLMLHYEAGGYNCLHQDLYGEVSFPLQMVFLLGQAGREWEGGEFILVEQQPRAQSRAEVVGGNQGQAIVFTTRYRPVKGARGFYRVNLRHGVSRVLRGTRYTLGIIFHDAK